MKTKITADITTTYDEAMELIKKTIGIPKSRIIDDALALYLMDALTDDELINRENFMQILRNSKK